MQRSRDAAVAADVEDRAALRDEVGFERLGQECRSGEVDGDRSVPPLPRQLFERELLADARVVDQQANLTLVTGRIDHRIHIFESLEVGSHAHGFAAECRSHRHGFGRIRVAAAKAEHDAMAALDSLQDEGAADAARSACHHRERRCHSLTNS